MGEMTNGLLRNAIFGAACRRWRGQAWGLVAVGVLSAAGNLVADQVVWGNPGDPFVSGTILPIGSTGGTVQVDTEPVVMPDDAPDIYSVKGTGNEFTCVPNYDGDLRVTQGVVTLTFSHPSSGRLVIGSIGITGDQEYVVVSSKGGSFSLATAGGEDCNLTDSVDPVGPLVSGDRFIGQDYEADEVYGNGLVTFDDVESITLIVDRVDGDPGVAVALDLDAIPNIPITHDFGDYASFPLASSGKVNSLKIGASTDAEPSANTNSLATGDDSNGTDDEDGVTLPADLTPGIAASMTVNVTNTSGASAFLNAWIDFNGNGNLTDAGEQVASNTIVANGTSSSNRTVNFMPPVGASPGMVGVRVRLTSVSSPGPDGVDGLGEVEDTLVNVLAPTLDFGDNASLPSASSTVVNTLKLGATTDIDVVETTNAAATGDDTTGADDEDGVTVPASLAIGASGSIVVNVTNTSGSSAFLNAWIDFNGDGDVNDAGEQVASNTVVANGSVAANRTINFTTPATAPQASVAVRVRLTSVSTPGVDGQDGNGEVEDTLVLIGPAVTDFGDYSGFSNASSVVDSKLLLGAAVDTEPSAVTNSSATGDDADGVDDEDGVTLSGTLNQGVSKSFSVTVSNGSGGNAFVNVWVDFDQNGKLTDANEHVVVDHLVTDGEADVVHTLSFTTPSGALAGATAMRVRLTNTASPNATGAVGRGEVEDLLVSVAGPLGACGNTLVIPK